MSNDTQVKQEANALMPDQMWIGARVGRHVRALLYSASDNETDNCDVEYVCADLLATVRQEVFKEAREMMDAPVVGTMATTEFHKGFEAMRRLARQVLERAAALEASKKGEG